MNKYTNKLYKFLNNYVEENKKYNFADHQIVKHIKKIFEEIQYVPINLKNSAKINKLHSYNDDCLLFIIYSELYNGGILQKYIKCDLHITQNINLFFEWYRANQFNIDLKQILKECKDTNIKYKTFYEILFKPINERISLHKIIYENMFISLDVVQHAESENLNLETFVGNNTDIEVYYISNKPNMEYISKIISFFRKLVNNDKYIKLLIFYGKQKKYMPSNKYICSDNVNTGVTESGRVIMIWREEEFYKVLIHELIHYFGIDFYISDDIYNRLHEKFSKKFLIDGFDRINESYTEALAMMIHSIMYANIKNEDINKILTYELCFSHFQIAKILHHFKCKKFSDVYTTKMCQWTSVCSYYIIKCFFMVNYHSLLDFWKDKGYFILKNQNEYEKIYDKILNTNAINEKLINLFIEHLENNNKNTFEIITLRMSMFQL